MIHMSLHTYNDMAVCLSPDMPRISFTLKPTCLARLTLIHLRFQLTNIFPGTAAYLTRTTYLHLLLHLLLLTLTYPLTFPDPLLARQRLTTQSRMNAYEFVSQSSCQWHSLIALATQSVALQKLQ